MPPGGSATFYEILGLSADADQQHIRRAHRVLARQYHPDLNKAPDAADRFAQVQRAYETLSDPAKRAAYDRSLEAHEQPPQPSGRPHYAWVNIADSQKPIREELDEELDEIMRVFFEPRRRAREQAR